MVRTRVGISYSFWKVEKSVEADETLPFPSTKYQVPLSRMSGEVTTIRAWIAECVIDGGDRAVGDVNRIDIVLVLEEEVTGLIEGPLVRNDVGTEVRDLGFPILVIPRMEGIGLSNSMKRSTTSRPRGIARHRRNRG